MIARSNEIRRKTTAFLRLILACFFLLVLVGCSAVEATRSSDGSNEPSQLQSASVPDSQPASTTDTSETVVSTENDPRVSSAADNTAIPTLQPQIQTATPASEPASPSSISSYLGADLQPQRVVGAQSAAVTALAFAPDGSKLAFAYSNGSVNLLQGFGDSSPLNLAGHSAPVRGLAFSPDGGTLASAGEDSLVMIWDTSNGSLVDTINTSFAGRALAVDFSPDGTQLAVGGHKCFVALYSSWSGILSRSLVQPDCSLKQEGSVEFWGLSYSPDGSEIITAEGQPSGDGGSIQRWNIDHLSQPETIKSLGIGISTMAISPDRSWIAVSLIGSPQIILIDTENGRIIDTLEGHQHRVNSLDISPDGKILASGSTDGTVRLWDTRSGLLMRTLRDETYPVDRVAFSPDGTTLASGSADGSVTLWSFPLPAD